MALVKSGVIVADGTVSIPLYNNVRTGVNEYTLRLFGTFGSGTVTVALSNDGTNNKTTMLDASGTAITATAAKDVGFKVQSVPAGEANPVYLTLTTAGSSGASITYNLFNAY